MKTLGIKFAAVLLLTGVSAQANLIDHGWYTEDTSSGLFWLDWTDTRGLGDAEVVTQMGPSQRFDGWRHATFLEIEALYWQFGLQSPHGSCVDDYPYLYQLPSHYCGNIPLADAEEAETAIRMLGDTYDEYAKSRDTLSLATDEGANATYGRIINAVDSANAAIAQIRDWEVVNRADGSTSDGQDRIWSHYSSPAFAPYALQWIGHALVRDTRPTVRPVPAPPAGAIDFETVQPADVGLQFVCAGTVWPAGKRTLCDGVFARRENNVGFSRMWLGIADNFDTTNSPVVRVTSFDYTWITSSTNLRPTCTSADMIYNQPSVMWVTGSELPVSIAPAPQGGGWCRATFDTTPSVVLNSGDHPDVPGVRLVAEIGLSGATGIPGYSSSSVYGLGFDNIVLETVEKNIEIDFDPSSSLNEIRPRVPGLYRVAIKQTRVADGDAYDFDAWKVNWQFLRFGPAGAQRTATAIVRQDYDLDGDDDYIVEFQVEDSGMTCFDSTLTVSGRDAWGVPLWGSDTVVPIDCEAAVEIDVEPWSALNEVRPTDSYFIPVGIMSKSIANGDDTDLDVQDIDVATLAFGPGLAPNITIQPLQSDLNGDSLGDLIVGFNSLASGIACGDTEVMLSGATYEGLPIEGVDAITTVECETSGCHP